MGEVEVKTLVWKGLGEECWGSAGPFTYKISPPNRTAGWRVWISINDKMASVGSTIVTMKAKDMNEAMVIAQEDFSTRILSALMAETQNSEIKDGEG